MKLKPLILSLSVALLVSVQFAISETFKLPPMGNKESGTLVVDYKEGGNKWTADWTTEKYQENGTDYIKIIFNGKGLLYPFSENVTWVSESIFKADGRMIPVSSVSTVKNTKGEIITVEEKSFDMELEQATFKRENIQGDDSLTKTFDFNSKTLTVEDIFMILRQLPFGTSEDLKTKFLSNEPELYKIELKQRGIETIKTPEGEVEAYKVELVPKLGVIGVLKVFFPKTYFWFTVSPPHSWIKYEGFEKGRSSPEVIMKVENFKSDYKADQSEE